MKRTIPLILALSATTALAEETRELDAHEHGVGVLNIALDGNTMAMEMHAPGADIVGFEYEAESAEDLAAIDAAIATLSDPQALFVLPAAADCTVTEASAELETEEEHEDHEGEGEEHSDEDHSEGEEDHAEEGHDDDKHDDHAEEEGGHTEFHAEYMLTCGDPSKISEITFAYFSAFENAREVEVQIVSPTGAQAFEVERDAPILELSNLF